VRRRTAEPFPSGTGATVRRRTAERAARRECALPVAPSFPSGRGATVRRRTAEPFPSGRGAT